MTEIPQLGNPAEKALEIYTKHHKICNCTISGAYTMFKDIAKSCSIYTVDMIILGLVEQRTFDSVVYNFYLEVRKQIENIK